MLNSAYVGDQVPDLHGELWSLMGVFRRFLSPDGTETEQGVRCGVGERPGDDASMVLISCLQTRRMVVSRGRWRRSEACVGRMGSIPCGAVAALRCCTRYRSL